MSMSNSIQRRPLSRSNKRQSLVDPPLGPAYTFHDGVVNPTGKWLGEYTSEDVSDIRLDKDDATKYVFYQKSTPATTPSDTHACEVLSTQYFRNFILEIDIKTISHTRVTDPPNAWEDAWIFFRDSDHFHHYYFYIGTVGVEFGKKDNDISAEEQIFLFTAGSPTLTLDQWYHIKVQAQGNRFIIWVDGTLICDVTDNGVGPPPPSPLNRGATSKMYDGRIGLYMEDSEVYFRNINVVEI